MARSKNRTGRPYLRARAQVLAASDVCWLCGHPGADQADHVIPLEVWPDQPVDPAMMRPAHGTAGCLFCPTRRGKLRKCNQEKGASLTVDPLPAGSRRW